MADIGKLIDAWEPQLKSAFLSAFDKIKLAAQIGLVAELLEKGDTYGAVRAVGLDPLAFRDLEKTIADAFDAGGSATIGGIPGLKEPSGHIVKVMFDVRRPGAEMWLRQHSSTLVTQIVDDQRQMIRQHLTAGMEKGLAPRAVALDLVGRIGSDGKRSGGTIGLTASQEAWARRYAEELEAGDASALTRSLRDKRFDKAVRKAIDADTPIPAELRAKMVSAYRNRALRYRAETIARTEAMTSLHQSQDEAFRQALAAGQVQASQIRKVWKGTKDARTRDTHRALDGESVGFHEAFVSPSGARLMYPGDPAAPAAEVCNCRCAVTYRVDHLANVR